MLKAVVYLGGFLFPLVASAGLKFDSLRNEIQGSLENNVYVSEFSFKNEGDTDVAIREYNATCSCMSAQVKGGKLNYKPGESGVIVATFNLANFTGVVEKTLELWLNDDPVSKPSVVLTTNINIPIIIKVEPPTVRWETNAELTPKTITVTMNHDEPIKVLSAETTNPAYSLEVKTIEEGKKYEVEVTPKDLKTPSLAIISIKTDCKFPRFVNQRAYALSRNPERSKVRSPIQR